jgi:hypothetical protein
MEAIRQIVRTPSSHEVMIKVPDYIEENDLLEVILLVKNRKRSFNSKIMELKEAVKDPMYQEDLGKVADDFKYVDYEGWE